jgi:hypothetical protein
MSSSTVWVQATDLDRLRTWHLQGVPGETLCDRSTQAMKAMPKAEWRQVMNPCPNCQKSVDAIDAAAEFQDVVDDPALSHPYATDVARPAAELAEAELAEAEPAAPPAPPAAPAPEADRPYGRHARRE